MPPYCSPKRVPGKRADGMNRALDSPDTTLPGSCDDLPAFVLSGVPFGQIVLQPTLVQSTWILRGHEVFAYGTRLQLRCRPGMNMKWVKLSSRNHNPLPTSRETSSTSTAATPDNDYELKCFLTERIRPAHHLTFHEADTKASSSLLFPNR